MARITVEDCLKKIDNQYDLVMLARERTAQLNAGDQPLVSEDNDKTTVVSLREIGDGKISVKSLEDSAINKLRKQQANTKDPEDLEDEHDDEFDKIYKGEISKSGTAILPSKRMRRISEKEKVNLNTVTENETIKNNDKQELTDPKLPEALSTESKPEN